MWRVIIPNIRRNRFAGTIEMGLNLLQQVSIVPSVKILKIWRFRFKGNENMDRHDLPNDKIHTDMM